MHTLKASGMILEKPHTVRQVDRVVLALHFIARQRGAHHLFPRGGDGEHAPLFGARGASGLVDGVRLLCGYEVSVEGCRVWGVRCEVWDV